MKQRTFYPGDKWLYFKIYLSPLNSNELLLNKIQPIINNWLNNNLIKKWFFIRYNDPNYHLRIRVELTDIPNMGIVIYDLRTQLSYELFNGIISNIQIDTYQREIERYGEKNIENCETFFYEDSVFVLDEIQKHLDDIEMISQCINWILIFLFSLKLQSQEIKDFLKEMNDRYQKEFNLSIYQLKLINNEHRKIRNSIINIFESIYEQAHSYNLKYNWIISGKINRQLLSSLIHMHVNRLFILNQRLYEFIIYHMLCKIFDSIEKKYNLIRF